MTDQVFIVPCCSKKLEGSHLAKELYISPLFRKMVKYIGNREWYILSAKYGFLSPDSFIDSYDKTLNKMLKPERLMWAKEVETKIRFNIDIGQKLIFFTGKRYGEFIIPNLSSDYSIDTPLKGLGIGQQLRWFNENTFSGN